MKALCLNILLNKNRDNRLCSVIFITFDDINFEGFFCSIQSEIKIVINNIQKSETRFLGMMIMVKTGKHFYVTLYSFENPYINIIVVKNRRTILSYS